MIWFIALCVFSHCVVSAHGYLEEEVRITDWNHVNSIGPEYVNGTDNPFVKHENKRLISGVVTFVGQHIARYILNKHFAAIEHYLFDNNPMEEIRGELNKILAAMEEVKRKVDDIGSDVVDILFHVEHNKFAGKIKNLQVLLNEKLDIFLKDASTRNEYENQILEYDLSQILDTTYGITHALRDLHTAIIEKVVVQRHYDNIMRERPQNDYKPFKSLREDVEHYLNYLFEMQEVGFSIWYIATKAKFNAESTLNVHLTRINSTYDDRLSKQNEKLDELFLNCEEPKMPKTYGKTSVQCDNGIQFGSICKQICAGSCKSQRQKNSNGDFYYPPQGYNDIQCLIDGKWSTNHGNEVKLGCSFCTQVKGAKSSPYFPYPASCYADLKESQCEIKAMPGYTNDGKQCEQKRCVAKRFVRHPVEHYAYWCYTNKKNKKWGYCAPSKIWRNEQKCKGETMSGKSCGIEWGCIIDRGGYYFCHHSRTKWEYSN